MYCNKCGTQNVNGERFCKSCGILLENNSQPMNNVMNGQQMYNQVPNQSNQVNNGLNQNYVDKAINPNMKKWAIISVIVPIAGIIWYWFIGLTVYLAVAISAAGFGFAEKGKMANKTLSTIGKVLNGILFGMAIVMFVLQLIEKLG